MNKQSIIDPFATTTINTSELAGYLFGMPRYLEAGVYQGVNDLACNYLAYTDGVEFWLKRYIAGHPKTLHRLFYEIRQFRTFDERAANKMTAFVLKVVGDHLVEQEWYELMGRYQTACKRIHRTFQIKPATSITDQLIQ